MSEVPDISISMITYNHGKYIAQAIEGVLEQQTKYTFELVIGEDCSTDDTRKIIERYIKKNPGKIKLVTSESNVGPWENGTRNLRNCQGRYIAIIEGDDYWTDPLKLEKQVSFLENNPDFSMSCHAVKTIHDGVEEKEYFVEPLEVSTFDDIVKRGHFIPTLSIVYRREAMPELPDWFKDLWVGDIPMVMLITHAGKNFYFKEIMGIKRKHQGGISQDDVHLTREHKDFCIMNKLGFYKMINDHLDRSHEDVLRPKISEYDLRAMRMNLRKKKFGKALLFGLHSLKSSPKTFIGLIFKHGSGN